ncbi:ATP-binding protein [Streptomyces flaveolus]|uniref:ATP-binding protein n=1 Tax=Streptomyces flaveolus TaxID=67297 RepID=UPI0033A3EAF7
MPARQLAVGALVSALAGWFLWSLLWNGYLGDYWMWPLVLLTPDDKFRSMYFVVASWTYYAVVFTAIVIFFGRLGNWPEVIRRARKRLQGPSTALAQPSPARPRDPLSDPAQWPQMRADGAVAVADRLTADLRNGQMSDVDYARIAHAWRSGRNRAEITKEVLERGAAACVHGSGARDLSGRVARHDLTVRQVRLGVGVDDAERQAHAYRGAGIALSPEVLGTSAVVVGPSDVDTATRVVYPVVESLCLQALTGQAAVVAVSSSRAATPRGAAFDVVIKAGDPTGEYCLDLYAGLDDPDEAAGLLAEALIGDLSETLPGGDSRRAATALAQLLGAWQAAHGHLPGVADLRDLVDDAAVRGALRDDLEARGLTSQIRELEAFERRAAGSDVLDALSNRIALLDRPAFDSLLSVPGRPGGRRAVSLQHLDRPVRVRVDLPERAHAEASRVVARLVLAQFCLWAAARADRDVFAGLVVDDAVQLVTPQSLRSLQRLRTSNAGVLLALRSLADVPESMRDPLLGAVGCRVACAGVSPWDAQHFAAAWGTEWVETRTVTHRQVRAEEPLTKVLHGIRRAVTGKHVTSEAVTVRREERQRWSASALANEVATGHAVISFTTVTGERTPPVLTKLDG